MLEKRVNKAMNPYLVNSINYLLSNDAHPGRAVAQIILCAELTQSEVAKRIGWSRQRLNDLIQGRRNLSTKSAIQLFYGLRGISLFTAHEWLRIQSNYNINKYERERALKHGTVTIYPTLSTIRKSAL